MTEKKKVLVVENQGYWRERIEGIVTNLGLLPTTCATADEATAKLANESFDLLVIAYGLERVSDGADLVRGLGEQDRGFPTLLLDSPLPSLNQELADSFPWVTATPKLRSTDDVLIYAIKEHLP